jgi:hypothetical protein
LLYQTIILANQWKENFFIETARIIKIKTTSMRLKFLPFIIPGFFCSSAFAQLEKIETDRPDQTESPYTVPKKYFQFEFGLNMEKDNYQNVQSTTFVLPTGLLKYGINDNIEFRLEFESFIQRQKINLIKSSTSSLQPIEVGFKTKLWEEHGLIPKTSFIIHTTIPKFSTKEYKHLSPAPNFRFTMQHELSNACSLGYNLGMEWNGESTAPTYTYTFAPGFTINEKWAGYVEVFGFASKEETPEHSIDGGLYFYPNNNLKLDVSAGYGLTKTAPDYYIAVGCSFRFKL